ncbi:MAG: CPBP family intramembrane metalloprotease domain-containing protein, partial [Planctomycetaceae bacterium]
MLNWRKIGLIVARELRDQIRDQRTLFMVVVLPLLLYPALGLGMMELTLLSLGQPRTVVVLGADELPLEPALIRGDRFEPRWFRTGNDPERLQVVTDSVAEAPANHASESAAAAEQSPVALTAPRREDLLRQAREVRDRLKDSAQP